ncbi:apoptosis-enhancing nuclease isoform X1 [Urocitellus parryii]|uniref:Apoptosis enhancing nuclease n=1 Tax=Urocitellus parryii TaxID=9999 RepID=A0A8D2I3Q2_UROPR|nr:apoptosis-enhancing nuclease isoform X1 [Urocitellus parryii]XP_026243992.1 apoptosis-enhancing nuclease isoform X1 [Urocitellus parryii]XP_026243994.1 apoptosis-enhancing nuclease isoform X1 [Urocitellus parryii]XP_026243995.1 apoptosis-enhancing nuclease isoform X1 [Urocitellus parryii]XP_026243996.1 apoptosis-enhancing nuclease isoform X1 [Urocitellus parryii]
MVPEEAPESAQCPCLSLTYPSARDVVRRRHKRRSRQHQRFMARKALLQEQGLLTMPPEQGSSLLPAPLEVPSGAEAAGSGRQHPRAEFGSGGPYSKRLTSREASGPLPSKCVAIDCEMVGTGPRGRVSELARCSVVSYHGDVLYDKYIRPEMPIVDYRTRWSGITRQHMRKAIPFQVAQKEILKLLKGKVVVGHALHNDFQALKYVHPRSQTRDTTYVPNLLIQPDLHTRARVSLKDLALQLLHKKIQVMLHEAWVSHLHRLPSCFYNLSQCHYDSHILPDLFQVGQHGHSSVEDATTAMELYRLVEAQWEQQAASSFWAHPEDREPDSSTDMEQYMEDQYWPDDLAQDTTGGTGGVQDGRE